MIIDIPKAIEFIKKAIDEEIPHLKNLHRENDDFPLWKAKMYDVLKAAFGEDSHEYKDFDHAVISYAYVGTEESFRKEYVEHLTKYEIALKKIIQRYELIGIPGKPALQVDRQPSKAFIAHGGKSAALSKLCNFLNALGVEPLVVEVRASEGRLTESQVDKYLNEADCGIILATYGHIIDAKTRKKHPRLNVVDELGRCRKVFPDRTILLLEKEVELPSNVSGIVYEHFTKQNMEKALIKVANELRAFGLIRAVKPRD